MTETSSKVPHFDVGDEVYIVGPLADRYLNKVGIVRQISTVGGAVYHYLVYFDGAMGSASFFGYELRRLVEKTQSAV